MASSATQVLNEAWLNPHVQTFVHSLALREGYVVPLASDGLRRQLTAEALRIAAATDRAERDPALTLPIRVHVRDLMRQLDPEALRVVMRDARELAERRLQDDPMTIPLGIADEAAAVRVRALLVHPQARMTTDRADEWGRHFSLSWLTRALRSAAEAVKGVDKGLWVAIMGAAVVSAPLADHVLRPAIESVQQSYENTRAYENQRASNAIRVGQCEVDLKVGNLLPEDRAILRSANWQPDTLRTFRFRSALAHCYLDTQSERGDELGDASVQGAKATALALLSMARHGELPDGWRVSPQLLDATDRNVTLPGLQHKTFFQQVNGLLSREMTRSDRADLAAPDAWDEHGRAVSRLVEATIELDSTPSRMKQ